ncbi:hypothetical protein HY632_01570 [Candidatus Uhrbacteria bacterium]|nr:hypothetical protein [Candidatus Uhrbacteria bacterium]
MDRIRTRFLRHAGVGIFMMAMGFMWVGSAYAADLPPDVAAQTGAAATGAGAGQQEAQLEVVVANIIRISLSLVGILLVAYLVFGGYKWMTSGGESKEVEEAKTIIRNAVIGLAIILLAYSISLFVIKGLLQATRNVQ